MSHPDPRGTRLDLIGVDPDLYHLFVYSSMEGVSSGSGSQQQLSVSQQKHWSAVTESWRMPAVANWECSTLAGVVWMLDEEDQTALSAECQPDAEWDPWFSTRSPHV